MALRDTLTRKAGPLKAWQWGTVVVVGTVAVVVIRRRKAASAPTLTAATSPYKSPFDTGIPIGGGGSSGGGDTGGVISATPPTSGSVSGGTTSTIGPATGPSPIDRMGGTGLNTGSPLAPDTGVTLAQLLGQNTPPGGNPFTSSSAVPSEGIMTPGGYETPGTVVYDQSAQHYPATVLPQGTTPGPGMQYTYVNGVPVLTTATPSPFGVTSSPSASTFGPNQAARTA